MGKKDFSTSQIGRFMESTKEPLKETAADNTEAFTLEANNNKSDAGQQVAPVLKVAKKQKEETKSKRVNLLIKPSLYTKAIKYSKKLGYKSFNDFINSILEQIIEGE